MEKKINLEEILGLHCNIAAYDKDVVLKAMKSACQKTLELAAENAEMRITENALIEEGYTTSSYDDGVYTMLVDKQSILNVINLIE